MLNYRAFTFSDTHLFNKTIIMKQSSPKAFVTKTKREMNKWIVANELETC